MHEILIYLHNAHFTISYRNPVHWIFVGNYEAACRQIKCSLHSMFDNNSWFFITFCELYHSRPDLANLGLGLNLIIVISSNHI